MTIEPVNPPELPRPSGLSHAIVASGGDLVFLAGQTALDKTGSVVGDDLVTQFEQALSNLLTALRAAGGAPEHLTSLTIYVTDLAGYRASAREIGAVWRRLAGPGYPAMAALEVSRLWDTAAMVEVQGFAVISPRPAPTGQPID
ncbi:MAG: RidA family protein [Nocardiopsaceae bacterium]|nr:RidA family protein [Nocardiopsaceae bacterium]